MLWETQRQIKADYYSEYIRKIENYIPQLSIHGNIKDIVNIKVKGRGLLFSFEGGILVKRFRHKMIITIECG